MKKWLKILLPILALGGVLAATTPLLVSCKQTLPEKPVENSKIVNPYFFIDDRFVDGAAYCFSWGQYNQYDEFIVWNFRTQIAFQKVGFDYNGVAYCELQLFENNFKWIEKEYNELIKKGYILGKWVVNML